jgi:2-oxoglutarate ferredoxin oxidoreductase subunit delta|uniref:4Fe-4S dicluster domain-containing protein n=1 Tax=Mesoaciditoga lauensis TaxID=1495039 RepID=A0A7V3RDW9_9BACT
MAKNLFDVNIDLQLCKACGICYWVCPTHAIVKGEFEVPKIADADKCIGCMQCANLCPDFAIDIFKRENANSPS